jgi:Tfp pilus assembly protein PilP
VQSPAPAPNHTLVGLLELGDRSAALFDVSGVTQRITVGEAIGASGWILVSVANQEAVIRRNGEVRSVYVGQKF